MLTEEAEQFKRLLRVVFDKLYRDLYRLKYEAIGD